LALPWVAVELERNAARYAALELIENDEPHRLDAAAPAAGECPSPDDLLDFCHGNLPARHALALQQHLDECSSCMDVATLALNDWGRPEPVQWLEVANNFQPGDCVDDRFEIVRFLACGGMGEVYEAIDRDRAERVALKAVLASASDNRHMLRSIRHEARLARKVRHPNVCHVHDPAGAVSRPLVPYFTMEYLEGETLYERLRREALSLTDSLDIAHQLLLGIQAIHRAGVLHLDIKSSNVMLRPGQAGRAVILDFGLARRADGAGPDRLRPLTGSLAYMPPEQILGRAPNAQNDIFAFGVVLYQMLTRELPFPAAQPSTATSLAQRLVARATAPSELQRDVPAWLDELVLKCLAEPDARYRRVSHVLEALSASPR
jgi:serine/threonine protein kinase